MEVTRRLHLLFLWNKPQTRLVFCSHFITAEPVEPADPVLPPAEWERARGWDGASSQEAHWQCLHMRVAVDETNRYLRIFLWALAPQRGWSWSCWSVFSSATLGSQHSKQRRSVGRVFKTFGTSQFEKKWLGVTRGLYLQGFVGWLGNFLNSSLK